MKREILDSFGDSIIVERMPREARNPHDVKVVFYSGNESDHDETMMMSLDADSARELAKALNDLADEVSKP